MASIDQIPIGQGYRFTFAFHAAIIGQTGLAFEQVNILTIKSSGAPLKIFRFFGAIYQDNAARQRRRRVVWKDLLLYLGNRTLQPLELLIARRYYQEHLPLVFIVGVPRSGTTLLYSGPRILDGGLS